MQGKQISWSKFEKLYQNDKRCGQQATGLHLVSKLKYEHIYLSSFSKMRVDHAAQILFSILYIFFIFLFNAYNYRYSVTQFQML